MSKKPTFEMMRRGRIVVLPKRRSVEKDYQFFDPPRIIWDKINTEQWIYKKNKDRNHQRDLAFMCLLYMSCARVSELTRFVRFGEKLPSVTKDQFIVIGDFLMTRNLRIIKRRFIKVNEKWKALESVKEYPLRQQIQLPLKGELNEFTMPIVRYLKQLKSDEELFKFKRTRGYQIVSCCTDGEFPHYLRDMGLKMWLRVYSRDLSLLQDFSGHKKIENLMRYLREIKDEQAVKRILSAKFKDFEPEIE